jgi:hypothetical protein
MKNDNKKKVTGEVTFFNATVNEIAFPELKRG